MIVKLKHILLSVVALSFVLSAVSSSVFAAPGPCDPSSASSVPPSVCFVGWGLPSCPQYVLTFPAWYRGVINPITCDIKIVNITDIIKIPLNGLEILIQAVAYVAVGYIIWGGFKYMKSQGDPGKITEAKGAIINAATGLGIALASVAIVEFIQGRIV